jgi:transforming growth factor-beta-induced protein
MRSSIRRTSVIAVVAALTLAACGDDSNDEGAAATTVAPVATEAPATTMAAESSMAESSMAAEPGTIVDVAVAAGSFTTLVAAVQAAGLVETLSGPGPFTVFAPTDEAFAAALESLGLTADELLADTETLTSILTYHVIAGEVPSSQVVTMNGQSAATVNGAEVTITVEGDTVMVNDATVTAVDVMASNGVIHVIDSVLLPPAA